MRNVQVRTCEGIYDVITKSSFYNSFQVLFATPPSNLVVPFCPYSVRYPSLDHKQNKRLVDVHGVTPFQYVHMRIEVSIYGKVVYVSQLMIMTHLPTKGLTQIAK